MMDSQSLFDRMLEDVAEATRLGRSVLAQAALQGHDDVLRSVLKRINNSSISSSSDVTPSPDQPELSKALSAAFLSAAEQGHSHCLSALQESCAPFLSIDGLMNAKNEVGNTALMLAAKGGRADCVKTLLQHNPEAQVAAVNNKGSTALMWAARSGHAQCVSQLLQHIPGTQVAAANEHGNTALIGATWGGHANCVGQLLQHSPEAQVAATDSRGETALMDAVWRNHPDCLALLLAHSPSTQIATGDDGRYPVVQAAAYRGHPQCLDLLLAHDPQPQHLDAAWLSALRQWDATHARTSTHTQCLERLLAKGALLPASAQEADVAKNRLFIQDFGARALVADRVNEAIMGLALSVRGKKRKAGQGEEQEGAGLVGQPFHGGTLVVSLVSSLAVA